MDDDLRWVIGIGVTVVLGLVGLVIGAFRNLANRITASSEKLHGRIDEVKDRYVRRDDLDQHINRLDRNIGEIREEMRANHSQVMDALRKD